MSRFMYDVEVLIPEIIHNEVDADDQEQAELFIKEYVDETYPEAADYAVVRINEI